MTQSARLKRETKKLVNKSLALQKENVAVEVKVLEISSDNSNCWRYQPGVTITGISESARQIDDSWKIINMPERLNKVISVVIEDP